MLYLTKVVGANWFLFDDDDSSFEMVSKSDIDQALEAGIQIADMRSVGGLVIPMEKANFGKGGTNVFSNITKMKCSRDGKVSFMSGGKEFKCQCSVDGNGTCMVMFNNGLRVDVGGTAIADMFVKSAQAGGFSVNF